MLVHMFTSDQLFLPTLFKDILVDGGKIIAGFNTCALFFPDYLLYIAYVLGGSQ